MGMLTLVEVIAITQDEIDRRPRPNDIFNQLGTVRLPRQMLGPIAHQEAVKTLFGTRSSWLG